MSPAPEIPKYHQLMWPTLDAVKALGGSGTIQEIAEKAVEIAGFSEEQQSVLHRNGPSSEIEYRLAWARTYLKGVGALENSRRGIWSITETGRRLSPQDMDSIPSRDDDTEESQRSWKEDLLDVLANMPPDAFERLAKRLLREAGFTNVTVTGRSGDGGIDGAGVYRVSLVSFPVFFQCKRWRGSVGSKAVRDFRGAMVGRGDKGLLITTASFTGEAKAEATRDGAPPIDLIDGDRLCELLKEFEVGVSVSQMVVEDVSVDVAFFSDL